MNTLKKLLKDSLGVQIAFCILISALIFVGFLLALLVSPWLGIAAVVAIAAIYYIALLWVFP